MTSRAGTRGLFDDEPPAPPRQPPGSRDNPYAVSALNTRVRALLEGEFPGVWVVGEISNFTAHSSGHWYFTLRDEGGEVSTVMFARENRRVRFEPRDGLEVLARGKLTVYPPRGRYQLVLDEIQPRREGALQLAFRQLEEKLRREGLFDDGRKRPVPLLPLRIGVVTAGGGAAFRDILRVLRDRFAAVTVILRDTRVQGEGAAADIAEAIGEFNRLESPVAPQVLIVGRGGGSLEDLWAFNEEIVVRAIVASAIPVVSAVGHEIDVTLSDLAADLRAATPSAAAEKVIVSRDEVSDRLRRMDAALLRSARLLVERRRRAAEALSRSRGLVAVEIRIREERQRVDELGFRGRDALGRLFASLGGRIAGLRGRLSPPSLLQGVRSRRHRAATLGDRLARAQIQILRNGRSSAGRLAGLLDSLSPLAVLHRGYALCFDGTGERILRDAAEVSPGDEVRVRLARGGLGCRVTETDRSSSGEGA